MSKFAALLTLICAFTAGCSTTTAPGDFNDTHIRSSVAHPQRSAADRDRDANRKPVQILAFFQIKSDQTVLDLYSGGGYYSEILARAVGPAGVIHAHNNQAYLNFARDEISQRYLANRLSNVRRITAENNELALTPNTYDSALLILGYHDIYFVDAKNGWPRIDGPKLLAEVFAALKPGAVLGIVDHSASAGAPADVGATLHRIDPQRALREIVAAGFVFEASSNILANANDKHEKPMFDASVKGKTDRFVYRFRRP